MCVCVVFVEVTGYALRTIRWYISRCIRQNLFRLINRKTKSTAQKSTVCIKLRDPCIMPVELDAFICREIALKDLWMVKRLKLHGMHQRIIGNNIFYPFMMCWWSTDAGCCYGRCLSLTVSHIYFFFFSHLLHVFFFCLLFRTCVSFSFVFLDLQIPILSNAVTWILNRNSS